MKEAGVGGQAGDLFEPLEKRAHDVMDRQAIPVISKNLFPLYSLDFV